jgi:hypothetical protein
MIELDYTLTHEMSYAPLHRLIMNLNVSISAKLKSNNKSKIFSEHIKSTELHAARF